MSVFVIEIHSVKIICLKNLMDCTRTRKRSLKLEESPAFPALSAKYADPLPILPFVLYSVLRILNPTVPAAGIIMMPPYLLWCCTKPPYNDIRYSIVVMRGES